MTSTEAAGVAAPSVNPDGASHLRQRVIDSRHWQIEHHQVGQLIDDDDD